MAADEQVTVIQSITGLVTVFDNANGHRMWSVQIGDPQELRFAAVTNERLVIVISGTQMYGLDKRTGDVAWQVDIPTAASAPPGMDDARAYVGSVNGTVYAYDLKFLDQISKNPLLAKDAFKSLKWQYKTGRGLCSPRQHGKSRSDRQHRRLPLRIPDPAAQTPLPIRDGSAAFRADYAGGTPDLRGDRGSQGLLP